MITLTYRDSYMTRHNGTRMFIYICDGDAQAMTSLIARAMTFGHLSLNEKLALKNEHKLYVSARTADVWQNRTTVQVSELWPQRTRRRKPPTSPPYTFSL